MTDLIDQLQEIRNALIEERKTHMARVAIIDKALAGQAVATPKKEAPVPKEPRVGTLTDLILQAVAAGPMTIKALQAALPAAPPKSVDATVRQLAATGRLAKDDQTPRRFSLPQPVQRAV